MAVLSSSVRTVWLEAEYVIGRSASCNLVIESLLKVLIAVGDGKAEQAAETMVRMAEIEPGMVVVDLGCGTGSVTEAGG